MTNRKEKFQNFLIMKGILSLDDMEHLVQDSEDFAVKFFFFKRKMKENSRNLWVHTKKNNIKKNLKNF
jgi:hypothetical protein